jgi:hypothetical protein
VSGVQNLGFADPPLSTITTKGPSMKVSLPTILFIVFLVLKLTGKIAWSWWWVTCPLWAGIPFLILVMALVALFALIAAWLEKR